MGNGNENGGDVREVPIVEDDFSKLLSKYKIKPELAANIAENISHTGGPKVFEDPQLLSKRLIAWSGEIAPAKRRLILEQWFAEKGINVASEVLDEVGVAESQKAEKAKKKEQDKKLADGAVWKLDIDSNGMPKIRMIKDDSEPGITLTEAKTAAKEIGRESDEPIVTFNEAQGKHIPNFKSAFVKQNLTAAWATARQMDKAMAEGEAADPMDIWIDQQTKMVQFKDLLGLGGTESKEKGTVGELVSALKDLQEMAKEGKAGDMPDWITDPMKFIETVKTIGGAGEAGNKPDWLSDPVAFIKTIREITGSEGKGDETIKGELAELRKTLVDMKDERHKAEMGSLQGQILQLQKNHETEMKTILEKVDEMKKPQTGRTELDILHEVATEGFGVAKTELAGMRGMIKEALGSVALPGAKTPQERDARKGKMRKALETDQEIDSLGRRLFLGES